MGQQELLNTLASVDGTNPPSSNYLGISGTGDEHPKDELLERDEIENTPFHVVGNRDRGYFIALGAYRLTELYPDKSSAVLSMDENKWTLILTMIGVAVEQLLKEKNA